MLEVPEGLQYSDKHEWVRGDLAPGSVVTVGITAYAADALGDVVYAEVPEVGTSVVAGMVCGELESTKAVSELFSPVTGEVVDVNAALESAPELINADVYGEGWIFTVKLAQAPSDLLDAQTYAQKTQ